MILLNSGLGALGRASILVAVWWSSVLGGAPTTTPIPPCLLPPVAGPVIEPFREPACAFCPGHRGLELAPAVGAGVVAAASGRVSFAGMVAGVRYVVIDHGDGVRTTYGGLASASVGVGRFLAAGEPLGTSVDRLFFGLRLGERYLDPAPFLAVTHPLAQLVPLNGRHRRAPRRVMISCPAVGGAGVPLR